MDLSNGKICLTRAARAGLPDMARAAAIAVWLIASVLYALLPGDAGAAQRSLRFERLTSENGLTQQSVLSILQDRQGFIWFGTQAGLHRFDGYRMTVFHNDPNDPGSLPDNFVSAAYQDAGGVLWFGTKGGLARFDPGTGRFRRHLLAQPGRAPMRGVTAILPAPGGELWLATSDGLVRFDPASGLHRAWRHEPGNPASLRDERINALALGADGALWIGMASGIDRLAPGAARFEHFTVEPAGMARRNPARDNVLSLSMGPRETLWIGTAAGLAAWRVDDAAPRPLPLGAAERMADLRIERLYHDPGAQLWVGTDTGGLKWRDPASGQFVSYRHSQFDQHSLSDNQVTSVLVDRTGTLWVGTYFGGVSRTDLASGGFARYGSADGLGRAKVRAVHGDPDGRIWVGTTGDGLLRLNPATRGLERIREPVLPGGVVTALALGGRRLWIGTPTGLLWRDPDGASGRVPLGPGGGASYVQALRVGRDGTLWIVTRGGLSALGPGALTTRSWRNDPDDPTSLGDNYGLALLEDRHGIVWIGTESGLERFDRAANTFTHYRHDPADPASLRHSRVYNLLESAAGELWIGTAGGLHRMEQGEEGARFRFFPFGGEQPAPPIGVALEDGDGHLWASTTAGITRIDPASGQTKSYTAKDGLIDGSYFVGSGWRGLDGRMHFGGMNGMTSFQPSEVRDNPFPPTVAITDLLVLNRSLGVHDLPARKEVTLSHRDAVFTLEFAALHYADPRGNRYAYRLDGFDQGWVDTTAGRRFATYTNLDPGRYVFRVRASNKDGVWNPEAATLAITITPPFWKTWWFRTFLGATVLALSYLAYRMRVHALVEQTDRLEREVGARTAELRLQKEDAERQKESVERAHRDIALLSDMGRVLTANLDSEAIMATLYQHVGELMDAPVFAVALLRPGRGVLELPFVMADGRRAAPGELALAGERHLLLACALEGREILLGDVAAELGDGDAAQPATLPGLEPRLRPASLLCVPVTVGERVLGAVTVQSLAPYAYSQVHLDMLGTLAAYVGVAIDNAGAYHQLKETQAQLAAHEKLASLGSLVAGVAHELNTPIGNSLLMASTLQERTGALAQRLETATLKRSDLEGYMAASIEASELIARSLHNAAELVSSFRQVSVDQASDQRRRFDLAQACHEIAATMMNTVRRAGHQLLLDVPHGIVMDGYPGPLGQVIINFVNNAMLHAFEAEGGVMTLQASRLDGLVRLTFRDDGRGIEGEHLGRIFDPFYTTRMGQGGTGLGLNIAWNIVTTLLGGTIRVESAPGAGTAFVLELPLVAPDASQGARAPAAS
jgi:ligand-binding sensor domain-containing protein/signal transduction histidine kinase